MDDIGRITVKRLERCLDILAHKMGQMPDGGESCLPLFRRIESDIEERRRVEDVLRRISTRTKVRTN